VHKRRAQIFVAAVWAVMSLAACGHPADRVPPGYADDCWGGRDNYPRYIAFSNRRLAVTVDATEKDWPLLSRIVNEVAVQHGLTVFDSSEIGPHFRAVILNACHASGIDVRLDKRIYVGRPEAELEFLRGKVVVALYTYRPEARFEPIANSLETKLRAAWKEHAKVERFPALLPSQKALPDEVRWQLRNECQAAANPKPHYCEGL
jgi:hypothetical protein